MASALMFGMGSKETTMSTVLEGMFETEIYATEDGLLAI